MKEMMSCTLFLFLFELFLHRLKVAARICSRLLQLRWVDWLRTGLDSAVEAVFAAAISLEL